MAAPGRSNNHLLSLSGSNQKEILMRTMGTTGTVFSIVTTLATSVATPEWHLYRKTMDGRVRYTTTDKGSDQRVEIAPAKHAAASLWQNPNPFYTTFDFIETTQQHLELTGEGWWVLDTSGPGNFPIAMWVVRPDRMQAVPGTDDFIIGYVYHGPDGEKIPLEVNEVICIKYPNPLDAYSGLSPVQSVMIDIDAMRYSAEYNRNFFLNSAEPAGLITVDKRLSDGEWDEFTARWRESHQGVSRAHRVGVLENGAGWTSVQSSMKDMDFANLRDTSRDVIREAWGIHKAILGNTENVNRANAQTAEEVFGQWKVVPRLNRIKNTVNHRLLPKFGTTGQGVEFDYDNPLPKDREADNFELTTKAQAAATLIAAGFDPDDVCEVVGLPSMEVAEKATQAPALPPGWVSEQSTGGVEPGTDSSAPKTSRKVSSHPEDTDELTALMRKQFILNRAEQKAA